MSQEAQTHSPDEMYCWSCGALVARNANFCAKCGAPLSERAEYRAGRGKSKTVSVVLAVLLSFWTWLYTYKRDSWKFWIGLGTIVALPFVAVVSIPLLAFADVGLSRIIPDMRLPAELLIFPTFHFALWVWAVADTVTRPLEWYEEY